MSVGCVFKDDDRGEEVQIIISTESNSEEPAMKISVTDDDQTVAFIEICGDDLPVALYHLRAVVKQLESALKINEEKP